MSEIRVDTISEKTTANGVSIDSVTLKDGGATLSDNLLFNASGKGVYLGTTTATASNLLDDYETGTWTPTLSPQTSGSITLKTTADKFSYTKIGDIVFLTGRIQVDSVSSPTGFLVITGLPFSTANLDAQAGTVHFPMFTSGVAFNTPMSSMLEATEGGTTGVVLQQRDNAGWIVLGADNVSATDFFTINGSYRVA